MNAFLQYQEKLEEQFLNTIDHSTFENLCHSHIGFFKAHLQQNFSYPDFSERTARAKNPLHRSEDLISYIALYGLAHYQRIRQVIDHVNIFSKLSASQSVNICIVDYGSGQGIATLALLDHLIASGQQVKNLKVILIEPSTQALKRAIHWIQAKAKSADITVDINTYACTFDELDEDFLLTNTKDHQYIHLFNNILDMYATNKYNLNALCNKMKNKNAGHFIIAVSPSFYTGNLGFAALHDLLDPKEIYLNGNGFVNVQEYQSSTYKIRSRRAPIRVYAASL